MEKEILAGLVNSISRFVHLVSCQSTKIILALKDLRHMVSILKFLKPVLDEVYDSQVQSSDQLIELFEDLDSLVNQARENLEKQPKRISKLCNVLQIGALVMRVQESSLKLCYFLQDLLQSSPSTLIHTCVQQSIQEIQCADQGMTYALIENALRDLKDPNPELLMRIAESIGLTSNHDLLVEWISLEKERGRADPNMSKEERGFLNPILDIFYQTRECLEKLDRFALNNGVCIPPYFRCHLSLEMMVDPVILASGQTYERLFIQKWLDSGLKICPKTRQNLPHTSLVPNDIVKALITSWCKENGIRPFHSAESGNILFPSSCSSGSEDTYNGSSCLDSLDKDSNSRHCYEIRNGSPQIVGMTFSNNEKDGCVFDNCQSTGRETLDFKSLMEQEQYSHGRNDSISSFNSTTELLGKPRNRTNSWECISFSSSKDLVISPWLPSDSARCAKPVDIKEHGDLQLSYVGSGLDGAYVHVQKLIEDLNCQSSEVQAAATFKLRLLAKDSKENRILIARCRAIPPLISLLYSKYKAVQENAVTTLLNLSINDNTNKIAMAETGDIDPFIHVLKYGSEEAKENTAAALFSLSTIEELRIHIGRSGAIKPLVDLLGYGSYRGKKDAAAALFNLSIFHENKARIIRAGAVKYLVELLDPERGMVDKSVALLANLSTVAEGCAAISQEGGIPLLVEVVDLGSQRGKENAASALLQLCIHSQKIGSLVLQEGAIPPLVALSQQGTPRGKEKAMQILGHFRSLRERTPGKPKS